MPIGNPAILGRAEAARINAGRARHARSALHAAASHGAALLAALGIPPIEGGAL